MTSSLSDHQKDQEPPIWRLFGQLSQQVQRLREDLKDLRTDFDAVANQMSHFCRVMAGKAAVARSIRKKARS